MPSTKEEYIANFRVGLDELQKYQLKPWLWDENPFTSVKSLFESIPTDLQVNVLKKAVGTGIRRYRAAASVIVACEQSKSIDDWISASLAHPKRERRDWMIQLVGHQRLKRFAKFIVHTIENDEQSRMWAVMAAAKLQTDECLMALVTFVESFNEEPTPTTLVIALSKYNSPLVAPHLQRVFDTCSDDRNRVYAAWGLARQDNREAIDYLIAMLDEPDSANGSRRAAQALSDLYGWSLEFTRDAPKQAKKGGMKE